MITNTARRLLAINAHALRFRFCFNKAHLDPYKHTTMSHSPHNMFVDLYDFGEYPEVILPASIPAKTYQPAVVSTAVDVINTRFATNLTVEEFNNNLDKSWARFVKKNLDSDAQIKDVLSSVLNRLGANIIVRESRWTWVLEQRLRLEASSVHFQSKINSEFTLGEFLEEYNALIERLVLSSSFGHSPYIPQAPSALEKHYVQEMADSTHEGVGELNNLKGENDNFINRAMGLLHRL